MRKNISQQGNRKRPAQLLETVLAAPGDTLQAKLYQGLRELIAQGVLAPNTKIPSTRRLAEDLDVSRNTVVAALEKLASDGWLETRHGAGTYVTDRAAGASSGLLEPLPDVAVETPFAPGVPGLDLFPDGVWNQLQARRWRSMPRSALQEGERAGWAGLRISIARHLRLTRGVKCEPQQVVITNGARAAITLAARVLARPGDRAWIEDPGYFGGKDAVEAQGLAAVPVRIDEEGIDVDAGEAAAPDARLAIVTSQCQFPTGAPLSAPRRARLLSWAERSNSWIVDNGYDSEFSFTKERPTSLAEDASARVIYVNSFNKSLFPALRIGYLVAPPQLVDAFAAARGALDGHSNVPNQMVLADFLDGGHYDEHMRRCRDAYAERRAALVAALNGPLAPWLRYYPHCGGLHVVAALRDAGSAKALAERARAVGIDITPMSRFTDDPSRESELLLGFSAFSPGAINAAARKLARVFVNGATQAP